MIGLIEQAHKHACLFTANADVNVSEIDCTSMHAYMWLNRASGPFAICVYIVETSATLKHYNANNLYCLSAKYTRKWMYSQFHSHLHLHLRWTSMHACLPCRVRSKIPRAAWMIWNIALPVEATFLLSTLLRPFSVSFPDFTFALFGGSDPLLSFS